MPSTPKRETGGLLVQINYFINSKNLDNISASFVQKLFGDFKAEQNQDISDARVVMRVEKYPLYLDSIHHYLAVLVICLNLICVR